MKMTWVNDGYLGRLETTVTYRFFGDDADCVMKMTQVIWKTVVTLRSFKNDNNLQVFFFVVLLNLWMKISQVIQKQQCLKGILVVMWIVFHTDGEQDIGGDILGDKDYMSDGYDNDCDSGRNDLYYSHFMLYFLPYINMSS